MGLGLRVGTGSVAWAYSVPCHRGQSFFLEAGAYKVFGSNGAGRLGDPVDTSTQHFALPLGYGYRLRFSGCGEGVLTLPTSPRGRPRSLDADIATPFGLDGMA